MSETQTPQPGSQQPGNDPTQSVNALAHPDPDLDIPADPDGKHQRILRQVAANVRTAWILGVLLIDMKATCAWQQLTGIGPFPDWTHYLAGGLHIKHSQASKYMAIGRWPMWISEAVGVERAYLLRQICDMTEVDETPEQAIALELPVPGGEYKPFVEMNVAEVIEAHRLMREEMGVVRRTGRAKPSKDTARATPSKHAELQQRAAVAIEGWIKPEQVRVRESHGEVLIDVTSVKRSVAPAVFSTLAEVLREQA